jgi:citrate lyase subunit beta/citryl-CoA lyase
VAAHGIADVPVVIRVNAAGSTLHAGDLQAIRGARFDAVMLAKCESGAEVDCIADAIGADAAIVPLIETARGLLHLSEILARPGVLRVAFGAYDFSLDIGCRPQWEPLVAARAELVWRSRAAERSAPWDSPSAEIRALAAVQREAELAAAFGFGGKMTIHPAQVEIVRAAFRPDAAELAWAREVVAAEQSGVAQVAGTMVDAPVLARARRILQGG